MSAQNPHHAWPRHRPNTQALADNVAQFRMPRGRDLLTRLIPFADWCENRRREGLDSYAKSLHGAVGPATTVRDSSGVQYPAGINLASQDYLNLSTHPNVIAAAKRAIDTMGVHSAGSPALQGNTDYSLALEHTMCEFLQLSNCILFPTGWAAGFGVIQALITPRDFVFVDQLAHACLQAGAAAATRNVHRFRHLDAGALESMLRKFRNENPHAGCLVVSETLFSMDSDTPDIARLQELCRRFDATLLVDCAHDLGCIGPRGGGYLELQNLLGQVDIVMGSFSKTFASNGGFVASNSEALRWHLRFASNPYTFSNALSPVQAAIVLTSLQTVRTADGAERRERLQGNYKALRQLLEDRRFTVLGAASPIVPVVLGDQAFARVFTRELLRLGGIVNLVEYPAVPIKSSRLRLQVMADHQHQDLEHFVTLNGSGARGYGFDYARGVKTRRSHAEYAEEKISVQIRNRFFHSLPQRTLRETFLPSWVGLGLRSPLPRQAPLPHI